MEAETKKIALLTLYDSDNYGALLQAFALQESIRRLGFECELIQHRRFGFGKSTWHKPAKDRCRDIVRYLLFFSRHPMAFARLLQKRDKRLARDYGENKARCEEFRNSCFTSLTPVFYTSIEQIRNDPPRCDGMVCGSDQIWNPSRFDGAAPFFLDFGPADSIRIAYAPSLAAPSIPHHMRKQYKQWLEKFRAVSAREKTACRAIEEATGIKAAWVLDPTFLFCRKDWERIAIEDANRKRPFLLCYFLARENFICALPSIRALANRLDADIVVLPKGLHPIAEKMVPPDQLCGPREFLGYIKNASFVFTDSFHGTALAVNLNKPFSVFKGWVNTSFAEKFVRITDLLDPLDLTDRVVVQNEIPSLAPIDYGEVERKLGIMREKSKKYLADALALTRRGH